MVHSRLIENVYGLTFSICPVNYLVVRKSRWVVTLQLVNWYVYLLSRCFYQKLLSGKTNITWNIWISFWLAFNICIQHLYVICYSKWIIYTSIKKTWYEQCCKKRSNHYPTVLEMVFLYTRPFRHLPKHSCSEDSTYSQENICKKVLFLGSWVAIVSNSTLWRAFSCKFIEIF